MFSGNGICLGLAAILAIGAIGATASPSYAASENCANMTGKVLEYGIAHDILREAAKEARREANSGGNAAPALKKIQFLKTTDRIPLRDGVIMYIKYQLQNLPTGIPVMITEAKTHPATQSPDGQSVDHVLIRQTRAQFLGETFIDSAFWSFSEKYPHEMIPGKWQIVVKVNECELVSQSFVAYRP